MHGYRYSQAGGQDGGLLSKPQCMVCHQLCIHACMASKVTGTHRQVARMRGCCVYKPHCMACHQPCIHACMATGTHWQVARDWRLLFLSHQPCIYAFMGTQPEYRCFTELKNNFGLKGAWEF